MKFCPYCGGELPQEFKFCPFCCKSLKKKETPEASIDNETDVTPPAKRNDAIKKYHFENYGRIYTV